ncbi:hypothetical protein [Deinococcus sp.]|uniref:hypothetical protein n=1 Tax=Deinococcus sp. TaxID=47478 RepID=UPI003B59874A
MIAVLMLGLLLIPLVIWVARRSDGPGRRHSDDDSGDSDGGDFGASSDWADNGSSDSFDSSDSGSDGGTSD